MDCDHYFNNSKALKEAMCFMMDPAVGRKTCYVQFPQRFDGIDLHDRYANRNIVFFDVRTDPTHPPEMRWFSFAGPPHCFPSSCWQINLKGLDGVQGPVYVGTGCCFNRQALYGYDPVLTEADLEPNIIVKSCCGKRKKKGDKAYMGKKQGLKRTESSAPMFSLDDIEEGVEGKQFVRERRRFSQDPTD